MREYRAGHVYKDVARRRWRGVVRYREKDSGAYDENGKPVPGPWKRKTQLFDIRCYPDSERGQHAAQEALAAFKMELIQGEPERAAREEAKKRGGELLLSPNPTVSEYINYYLSERLPNRKRIEPSTMTGYRRMEKTIDAKWGGSGIGDVRLTDLRPYMVEQWRNRVAAHYAPVTVRYTLRLLKSALESAVSDGLIDKNPASSVTAPSAAQEEVNFLDATERDRLLADLDTTLRKDSKSTEESRKLALGVKIALLTGMREGEICGMRWTDVDFGAQTLAVRKSIGRDGEKTYVKDTKTTNGRRTIPIPHPLAGDLVNRKLAMREKADAAHIAWSESMFVLGEPVWSDAGGGWLYLNPRLLWRGWKRRANRLGLRGVTGEAPKFHGLRHTFATVAAHSGIPETSLKEIMGHSSIETTHRYYIGVDDEVNRRAMDAVMAAMTTCEKGAK